MQGDDVGMGAYLAEHLDFSLSRERIGSGQHNGKRDLAASFPDPKHGRSVYAGPPRSDDRRGTGRRKASPREAQYP